MNQRLKDEIDKARQEAANVINAAPKCRTELEAMYGQVWDTDQLRRDFEVQAFAAPVVVVVRRSDGRRGSLYFQHSPRFYFDFLHEG